MIWQPAPRDSRPSSPRLGPAFRVLGAGARCGVARSAPQLEALARADRVDIRPSELADGAGRGVRMHLASRLPEEIRGLPRLIALAAPAVREAVTTARRRRTGTFEGPIPVFLATSDEGRPDSDPARDRELLEAVSSMTGIELDRAGSRFFPLGHAGFAAALAAADAALEGAPDGPQVALIGGVDSYNHPDAISWLDERGRRHLPGASTGVIPAEGSAFLLVSRPDRRDARLATGISTWISTGRTAGDRASALRDALSISPLPPRHLLTHDTGAPDRHAEWLEVTRSVPLRGIERETLPWFMGDAGAATGALLAALVDRRLHLHRDGGAPVLVSLRSEHGLCGSFVMGSRGEPRSAEEAPREASGPIAELARVCLGVLEQVEVASPAAADQDEGWRELSALARPGAGNTGVARRLERATAALTRARLAAEGHPTPDRGPRHTAAAAAAAAREAAPKLAAIERHLAAARAGAEAGESAAAHLDAPDSQVDEDALEGQIAATPAGLPVARPVGTGSWAPFSWLLAGTDEGETEEDEDEEPESSPAPDSLSSDPSEEVPPPAADRAPPRPDRVLSEEELGAVRSCLETAGRLRWQRSLRPETPWLPSIADTEERLLRHLEAVLAIARPGWGVYTGGPGHDPSIDIVSGALAREVASLPGDQQAFALALLLCSIDAPEGPRVAALALARGSRVALRSAAEPAIVGLPARPVSPDPALGAGEGPQSGRFESFRLAFQLAPGPHVRPLLEDLLTGGDTSLLRFSLEVSRARREASFAPLVPLTAHPDIGVRAAAVRALAHTPEPEVARAFLERLAFLHHPPEVTLAIADSLLRLDSRAGLELARHKLSQPPSDTSKVPVDARSALLRLVALAGAASDLRFFEGATSPVDIESAGWLGHAGSIDWLVARLSPAAFEPPGDITVPAAAARALHRLTGATAADLEESALPVTNPSSWKTFLGRHRARVGGAQRLRHGLPITPAAVLDELVRPGVLQSARVTCLQELSFMLPGVPFPEPDDWTARQLSMVRDVREMAERGELRDLHAPGEWSAARLGRRLRARQER